MLAAVPIPLHTGCTGDPLGGDMPVRVFPRTEYGAARNPQARIGSGSAGSAGLVVDLGPLEVAGVVDVDRLPLGVRLERRMTGFAVAVAGALDAAEREVCFRPDRPGVHVADPSLEVVHGPECGRRV